MKIIAQSHYIEFITPFPLETIERIARTCYKSEGKICEGSATKLVSNLIKRGHEAMIEHAYATVRFITDRGVSHELVRHRLASFAQESTRYVKYDGDMEFILPVWHGCDMKSGRWQTACGTSEEDYKTMLEYGATPQEARQVLNNSLKTEIVVTADFREWRKIFQLRTDKAAHPQMRALMIPLLRELQQKVPVVFDDIKVDE